MRPIKFRGKRTKHEDPLERWIEGSYVEYTNIRGEKVIGIMSSSGYMNDIIPETVGQFTGLLDKNSKEIYEGDILLIDKVWNGETEGTKIYNVVGIKDGCFGYIGENTGKLLPFCYNKVVEEIVGNVYDNPELLKGGNQ